MKKKIAFKLGEIEWPRLFYLLKSKKEKQKGSRPKGESHARVLKTPCTRDWYFLETWKSMATSLERFIAAGGESLELFSANLEVNLAGFALSRVEKSRQLANFRVWLAGRPTWGCLFPTWGCLFPTSGCHLPTSGCHLPTSGRQVPTSGCHLPTSGCSPPTWENQAKLAWIALETYQGSTIMFRIIKKIRSSSGHY